MAHLQHGTLVPDHRPRVVEVPAGVTEHVLAYSCSRDSPWGFWSSKYLLAGLGFRVYGGKILVNTV